MKLVIVESPAKAKTINRYLGDDYKVLASYGHVCDLPSKDGSVLPDEDFAMKWHVSGGSEKRIGEISSALKSADRLILATDPDREGEAISWHVLELLQDRGLVRTSLSSASSSTKLPKTPSSPPWRSRANWIPS